MGQTFQSNESNSASSLSNERARNFDNLQMVTGKNRRTVVISPVDQESNGDDSVDFIKKIERAKLM